MFLFLLSGTTKALFWILTVNQIGKKIGSDLSVSHPISTFAIFMIPLNAPLCACVYFVNTLFHNKNNFFSTSETNKNNQEWNPGGGNRNPRPLEQAFSVTAALYRRRPLWPPFLRVQSDGMGVTSSMRPIYNTIFWLHILSSELRLQTLISRIKIVFRLNL